jgi:hypothetical protein
MVSFALLAVDMNCIPDMGPNSDGFGGILLFSFHFFLPSVPTTNAWRSSGMDKLFASGTVSPAALMRVIILCFMLTISFSVQTLMFHIQGSSLSEDDWVSTEPL